MRSDQQNADSISTCSPIVDLRQYTLYPGTRDAFVELFDREFVETQEAAGMRIIGQFRDLGDPNRFVWLRGFADMPARAQALSDFYLHGAAWKAHAEAARAHMIDSSDALLLRPARAQSGFALAPPQRRPALDAALPPGIVVATVYPLSSPADGDLLGFFEDVVCPALRDAGATLLGSFVTEPSPNNFPRLPLREDENVFVLFTGFADLAAYHAHMTALGQNPRWRAEIAPALLRRIHGRPQVLRLAPTSRSQLRACPRPRGEERSGLWLGPSLG
jgi:quinol monooxygenase YgiN